MRHLLWIALVFIVAACGESDDESTCEVRDCCVVCDETQPCGDECFAFGVPCDQPVGCACSFVESMECATAPLDREGVCNSDRDCGDGLVCEDFACVEMRCTSQDDCGRGDGRACQKSNSAGTQAVCVGAECIPNDTGVDAACDAQDVCKESLCLPTSCRVPSDCPALLVCDFESGVCMVPEG